MSGYHMEAEPTGSHHGWNDGEQGERVTSGGLRRPSGWDVVEFTV